MVRIQHIYERRESRLGVPGAQRGLRPDPRVQRCDSVVVSTTPFSGAGDAAFWQSLPIGSQYTIGGIGSLPLLVFKLTGITAENGYTTLAVTFVSSTGEFQEGFVYPFLFASVTRYGAQISDRNGVLRVPQAMTAEELEAFEARVRQVRLTKAEKRAIDACVKRQLAAGPSTEVEMNGVMVWSNPEQSAAMRACLDVWYEQRGLKRWDWDDLAKARDDLRASWVAFIRAAATATTAAKALR